MNESFEHRPLLDRDTLRALQQRQDAPSLVRLALHLGAFLLCMGLVGEGYWRLQFNVLWGNAGA